MAAVVAVARLLLVVVVCLRPSLELCWACFGLRPRAMLDLINDDTVSARSSLIMFALVRSNLIQ